MELSCRVIPYTWFQHLTVCFRWDQSEWVYACWKACCLTIQRKWKWPGTCWMWDLNAMPGQRYQELSQLFVKTFFRKGSLLDPHISQGSGPLLILLPIKWRFCHRLRFVSTSSIQQFFQIGSVAVCWSSALDLLYFLHPTVAEIFQQIESPPSAVVPLLNNPSI